MSTWALEETNIGEVVEHAEKEGAQMVTKQGVETVVVVPVAEWKRIKLGAKPTMKDVLLAPEPRFDFDPYMRKRELKMRPAPSFDD